VQSNREQEAYQNAQIHRHHKRTVYASNSFPVESYPWNCDDEELFYYGQPKAGNKSTPTYWQGYQSPTNPFIPTGFLGTCQFPQITAAGLDDSWQHGHDLYGVYHDLLGFLPDDANEKVSFRVTQNVITSEVAGMVVNGMFNTQNGVPLLIEVRISTLCNLSTLTAIRPVDTTLLSQLTPARYLQNYSTVSNPAATGPLISRLLPPCTQPWTTSPEWLPQTLVSTPASTTTMTTSPPANATASPSHASSLTASTRQPAWTNPSPTKSTD